MKESILILYDFFFPAYKAGGIIQSTFNLYTILSEKYEVNVICSKYDLDGLPLDNSKKLPNVNYSKKYLIIPLINRTIKKGAKVVYLNGVFSAYFFLLPLIYLRVFHSKVKIVIAPRGMLQNGALKIKSLKKIVYLRILKHLGLFKNVLWHATDDQELEDVKKLFGKRCKCLIALNIPKQPIEIVQNIDKKNNSLRIIYLSLITEKKNLHLVLTSLKGIEFNLELDIFGPIKEINYWNSCKKIIAELPSNISVNYLGAIEPLFVQEKIQSYNALILPSKGENFGHAIYESLSVGRPVIISNNTPWQNLDEREIGWNVGLSELKIQIALNELNSMSPTKYNTYSSNALMCAREYYFKCKNMVIYNLIFNYET